MSRLRVFRQTGWFIAGLMTGLPATAAPAEASSMAGVAVAGAPPTPPGATAPFQAMPSCRRGGAGPGGPCLPFPPGGPPVPLRVCGGAG